MALQICEQRDVAGVELDGRAPTNVIAKMIRVEIDEAHAILEAMVADGEIEEDPPGYFGRRVLS